MKKIILLLITTLLLKNWVHAQQINKLKNVDKTETHQYCATDKLNSELSNQSASYKAKLDQMNSNWQKYAIEKANLIYNSKQNGDGSVNQAIYHAETLPVIFHKIINGTSSPITSSITKPQLQAALNVLNQIYAGSATGSKAAGVNTDIQFCLAEVDALGNPITSYTYTNPTSLPLDNSDQTQIINLSSVVQNTLKFPPTKYINIYIIEDITSPVAGFAYMPPAHGSNFDGIYIEAQYLLPPTSPNDLAYNTTVLSHEMGHYLGLFHTFGICNPSGSPLALPSQTCSCFNNNCLFDGDMVCDTPPDFSISPAANCSTAVNTCNTDHSPTITDNTHPASDMSDLTNNYMDYGDWNCQNSFTQGQINRMHFMIDVQDGPRNSLLNSNVCNALCVSNCTTSINPITTTTINNVYYPNTLNLTGPSVSYTFNGNLCTGSYNTINWALINLATNATVTTGTGNTFPTTFTSTGNYRIVLTTSNSTTTPLCKQTATLNIQVLPPASCPPNLDMSNGWNQNWQRIQYEGGWARTTNNGSTFVHPTTIMSFPTGPNGTTNNDPFLMTSTFNDPNFPSITMLPSGITKVMRVGALITPTTTLNPGDAQYVTYTFSPTQANSKLRVWYLGMRESDPASVVFGNNFATATGGSESDFGIVCKYDFYSASAPTTVVQRGTTHTGAASNAYYLNDLMDHPVFNGPTTSTMTIGTRTMEVMSNWQYKDLDFSEFICASPTITITFFARSDEASNPGFHHSYAYFGATCLPGIFKDIDLNLQNKDIACMADVGESCTTVNLLPPNNFTFFQNGNNYSGLLDVDLEESNDGIIYTVVPNLPAGSNISTAATPVLNLCKSPDNHPYKYYRVTYTTLCQTITNTLTIFQGFVHTINDCASNTMSGGSFINAPIVIGTQTVSPDKYVQYCGTTTLSLNPPCWWQAGDPAPTYKWQKFTGTWTDIPGETNPSLTLNGSTYNVCTQYRRVAKYRDIYCNTDTWIPSEVFSVTNLQSRNFTQVLSGPDVCVNDPATISINNFWENQSFTCDIELAAQTATAPVTNTVSFTFYSNSNCSPTNSITAMTGPSVLTYTYTNSLLNSPAFNIPFTFINTMYTTNGYAHAVVEFNRYGCISTHTINSIPIKVKASAIAGTITTNSCLSLPTAITGNNPNATGYYWQYSYNSTFTPTLSLTSSTQYSVSIPSTTFTSYPIYIRRVANGTSDCPNPAYSNTLVVSDNSVAVSVVKNTDICSGTSATITASGATSYTWTAPPATTTTINPFIASPTVTTIYTVTGTNNLCCSDTQTTSVTVLPSPTINISASSNTMCIGSTVTLTASGANDYDWSTGAITNSIVVSPTVNTTYTVIGSNPNGCTSTKTIAITVVSGINFSVSASTSTVCSGNCSTLTSSGVNTYTWLPANTTGTTAVVCPTTTTTYSVLGLKADALCPFLKTITITVLPNPTITIAGSMSICLGNSTTLTASGGVTYTWSPSGATTASMSTNTTGVKTVTATGLNGCKATKSVTVGLFPNSNFTVTPTTASICLGNSFTFTASTSPITAYTWTPSGVNTNTATFSPTATTIYSVTGKNKGTACPYVKTVTLTVLPNPTVTISQGLTICQGGTTTASVTGGGTYLWSTGATNYSTSVNMTGPVTVTVTGSNGCKTIATTTVNWNTSVSISPATSTICSGTSTVLTGSGSATTYTWMPGNSNSNPITVSPVTTTIYTLSGAKNNCIGRATSTVYVVPSPTANISGSLTICYNTTTLTATGGGTYLWNTGITTPTIAVNTTGVKTVTVTASNGCTSAKSVTITQPGPPQCYNPGKMSNDSQDQKSLTEASHTIYPNPANQSFSINQSDEISMVEIYDYTGKLLRYISKENKSSFEDIDIKYYTSGIYIIRVIDNNNEVELFKLIKE